MQYFRLLQRNPDYARLWSAQIISLVGDWFNTIVLGVLVTKYSNGSGLAISLLLLARFLPPLLLSPLAGVLLDHFDRRRLLILSDVARVFVVLGFLLVDSADRLWLVYLLTVLQFSFSAVFEPGRSALIPSLVRRDDLVPANILGSITWSVSLAIGGALGGLISGAFGASTALILDAATFAISALLLWQIRTVIAHPQGEGKRGMSMHDYIDGLRFARRNPGILAALTVKAGGSVGNIDALMIIYATVLFVIGQDGSLSLGIMWCAFGVGAVLGPIVIDRWSSGTVPAMRRLILAGYALISAGWFVLAGAPTLAIAAIAIIIKAMGSSVYWTYSSAILQQTVPDAYLGRIFSLDTAGFQFMSVVSIVFTGIALEHFGAGQVREITAASGLFSLLPLLSWLLVLRWLGRQREPATLEAAA